MYNVGRCLEVSPPGQSNSPLPRECDEGLCVRLEGEGVQADLGRVCGVVEAGDAEVDLPLLVRTHLYPPSLVLLLRGGRLLRHQEETRPHDVPDLLVHNGDGDGLEIVRCELGFDFVDSFLRDGVKNKNKKARMSHSCEELGLQVLMHVNSLRDLLTDQGLL